MLYPMEYIRRQIFIFNIPNTLGEQVGLMSLDISQGNRLPLCCNDDYCFTINKMNNLVFILFSHTANTLLEQGGVLSLLCHRSSE